jgi:antagonist of KipI
MEFRHQAVSPLTSQALAPRKVIRVTAGPQEGWFTKNSVAGFYGGTYRVSEESNRMGLRLQGPEMRADIQHEMLTEPVALGAIQIPAGGQPIILFVEQQTTGGYPKIANVISADLSSVGQLRPRDEIRFEQVSAVGARSLICEQEALLRSGELWVP